MPSTYPHPTAIPHRNLDPSSPGTIIQYTLAVESILHIGFGALLILSPLSALNFLAISPKFITSLSVSLVQIIGGLATCISIPMLFAVPNTRSGIAVRAPMYCYLVGIEVFLIVFLGYVAIGSREKETGLSSNASVTLIGILVAPLGFRMYALWAKPQWFGRYKDGHSGKSE
jgi:hypothetical protein